MIAVPNSVVSTRSSSRPAPADTSGARLVAVDRRELPLKAVTVRADACAGLARVVLEHRFENPFEEPLQVTYQAPLPADSTVAGYEIVVGERRIVGEIERRERARERFEE